MTKQFHSEYIFKENKNTNLKIYTHPSVHRDVILCIHNKHIDSGMLISHKNEILPYLTTWMDLDGIRLSEMSDREIQIHYFITYVWNIKNKMNKYNKTEKNS